MSNFELGVFLVGGALALLLAIWSSRRRDFERQGNLRAPFLNSLAFALIFASFVGRVTMLWLNMSADQLLMAGLAAGCFSTTAILMATRAYRIRKARG